MIWEDLELLEIIFGGSPSVGVLEGSLSDSSIFCAYFISLGVVCTTSSSNCCQESSENSTCVIIKEKYLQAFVKELKFALISSSLADCIGDYSGNYPWFPLWINV
jgi:hypothetical protein